MSLSPLAGALALGTLLLTVSVQAQPSPVQDSRPTLPLPRQLPSMPRPTGPGGVKPMPCGPNAYPNPETGLCGPSKVPGFKPCPPGMHFDVGEGKCVCGGFTHPVPGQLNRCRPTAEPCSFKSFNMTAPSNFLVIPWLPEPGVITPGWGGSSAGGYTLDASGNCSAVATMKTTHYVATSFPLSPGSHSYTPTLGDLAPSDESSLPAGVQPLSSALHDKFMKCIQRSPATSEKATPQVRFGSTHISVKVTDPATPSKVLFQKDYDFNFDIECAGFQANGDNITVVPCDPNGATTLKVKDSQPALCVAKPR